jgi:hypothetical protein
VVLFFDVDDEGVEEEERKNDRIREEEGKGTTKEVV